LAGPRGTFQVSYMIHQLSSNPSCNFGHILEEPEY